MKRILRYLIIIPLMAAWAGCTNDSDAGSEGPTVALKSIEIEIGAPHTRADASDPTMSDVSERAQAGHLLNITLGGLTSGYVYSDGVWVPSGDALEFPGYGVSALGLTLAKETPGIQDGTKEKLLDADVLEYNETVIPAPVLTGIKLSHAKSLIQLEPDFAVDNGSDVRLDDIISYQIPSSAKYQAIIEPGTESFTITLSHNGQEHSLEVSASDTAAGRFMPNYRYDVRISLDGRELVLKAIAVEPWTDLGEVVMGEPTTTYFEITNRSLSAAFPTEVIAVYRSGITEELVLTVEDNTGKGSVKGLKNDVITELLFDSRSVPIGRLSGGSIILDVRYLSSKWSGYPRTVNFDGKDYMPVGTITELQYLDSYTGRALNYLLEADLYLSGLTWKPMAITYDFRGIFNGQGYAIHDMYVDYPGNNTAFIANMNKDAVLRNLTIASGNVMEGAMDAGNAGRAAFVGINYGLIENCVNHADIRALQRAAGITATNYGTVDNCINYGDIAAVYPEMELYAAGISVYSGQSLYNSYIKNCKNYGKVTAMQWAGGIASDAAMGSITDCENYGEIVCTNAKGGGIVGEARILIENCKNHGTISGTAFLGGITGVQMFGEVLNCTNDAPIVSLNNFAGGICGQNNGTIDGCTNTADVSGDVDWVGGIAGALLGGTVQNSVNKGKVTGKGSYTGGIAGESHLDETLEDGRCFIISSTNEGDVKGVQMVGGITGDNYSSVIRRSVNKGKVEGLGTTDNIYTFSAGIAGRNFYGEIVDCVNSGKIEAGELALISGVTGENTGVLAGCINRGEIATSAKSVGGIVSDNHATVQACYNTAKVSGAEYVGGIAGNNYAQASIIVASYSTGEVSGDKSGGLAGGNNSTSRIQYSYWTTAADGIGANNNTTAADVIMHKFSSTDWPAADPTKGWGTGSADYGGGYGWKSLGKWDATNPVYPVLFNESSTRSAMSAASVIGGSCPEIPEAASEGVVFINDGKAYERVIVKTRIEPFAGK